MQRSITQVEQSVAPLPTLKRVAAYARVSSGKDAMLHSLSAQVSFYSELIQHNPEWIYMGVYSDEALTGTKADRPSFQQMLEDCRAGKIDMVITKSISRFSRNTVTLLESVRELKKQNVDIFFERENIHSMSGDGELMLTILASFAQEESLSVSENCKWRVKRNFEDGKPWNYTMLGYRNEDGILTIVPEEAKIVSQIFADYLSGLGVVAIINKLNKDEIPTRMGGKWNKTGVMNILRNYAYTGNLLLQKTYRENHLSKRKLVNDGVLPMYLVKDSHEPIIEQTTFDGTQSEIQRRAEKHTSACPKCKYPFSGIITCGGCGATYRRKITATGIPQKKPVWICSTFNSEGKHYCPTSKQIPEDTLYELTAKVLGTDGFDEGLFKKQVTEMVVPAPNRVIYVFKDGRRFETEWKDRSRSQSWTDNMRHATGEKTKARSQLCRQQQELSQS